MSSKWLDQNYIDRIMAFAKIMAKSRTINIHFRNDVETCFMLTMQADIWGVHPEFVAANSFFDTYGRISQTGKLVKLVLLAHDSVKDVTSDYSGDWSLVNNKFKLGEDQSPRPLWNVQDESGLYFELKVQLTDGTVISEKVCMGDIDPSIRALNEAWVSRPYNQIFNHTIRQVAFGRLSHLLNGIETDETHDEIKAVNKQLSQKMETNSASDELASPTSDDVEQTSMTEQPDSEPAKQGVEVSQLVKELLDDADEIQELIDSELVEHHVKTERLSEWVDKVGENNDVINEHEKESLTKKYTLMHKAIEPVHEAELSHS